MTICQRKSSLDFLILLIYLFIYVFYFNLHLCQFYILFRSSAFACIWTSCSGLTAIKWGLSLMRGKTWGVLFLLIGIQGYKGFVVSHWEVVGITWAGAACPMPMTRLSPGGPSIHPAPLPWRKSCIQTTLVSAPITHHWSKQVISRSQNVHGKWRGSPVWVCWENAGQGLESKSHWCRNGLYCCMEEITNFNTQPEVITIFCQLWKSPQIAGDYIIGLEMK